MNVARRSRCRQAGLHLLCLLLIFILPEVLKGFSESGQSVVGLPWRSYIRPLLMAVLFYVNFFFFVPSSARRGVGSCLIRLVCLNLVGFLVVIILLALLSPELPVEGNHDYARVAFILVHDLGAMILIVGLAVALRMSSRLDSIEHRHRQLESASREMELKGLMTQLNPHFLFNSLNNIYALIEMDDPRAKEAVHDLSRLLRYMMYESGGRVPLEMEAEFVSRYINLMRLRMSPDTKLDINIDVNACAKVEIAPLLFLTIVENVFKHGLIKPDAHPVMISLVATPDGNVCCTTSNATTPTEGEPDGIGLRNLRRRLSLLYGDKASLSTNLSEKGIYTAQLIINILS